MSSSSRLTATAQTYFQFKASFSPCIVFEILQYDLEGIKHHLAETIRKTPNFFMGAPVIIDLEKMKSIDIIPLEPVKNLLLSHGILPIGTRGGNEEQQKAAAAAGLPAVMAGRQTASEPAKNKSRALPVPAKLITQPIRSGMQVYAGEGDLIVTTQVSPGAELMADGHIHVYGTLRGRAMAGVHGNQEARIFCRSLEADLVAIAGYYLTRDEIQLPQDKSSFIQIYLKSEQLQIETL
ncbi:Septum site-determining protein MinC [Aquicella siphonis]|uniref:Probable septum site-determining protein MinC n=1 Tax=Aquicella siphonis TaxID=254247 RepID=A0A5E4PFX9_9COXI|nr:septum site-determining protein MinC [Aquicella siphonis]VVC75271.1 Septum site-determining protein MinC [Aquicella siphonis]